MNAALALESAIEEVEVVEEEQEVVVVVVEEVEETERGGGQEIENALVAFKMSFFLETNI